MADVQIASAQAASANHATQTADVQVLYSHPKLFGGKEVNITGFKLGSNIVDTSQAIDNSIIIPLVGGGTIQLINGNEAGTISFSSLRLEGKDIPPASVTNADGSVAYGLNATDVPTGYAFDVVRLARAQRGNIALGAIGATIKIVSSFNGKMDTFAFNNATVKQCPPLKFSGNDIPDYSVQFNYAYMSTE